MLGKLLKYDLREAGKLVIPVLLGFILISILGKFMIMTELFESLPDFVTVTAAATYILIVVVCSMGIPIYMLVLFYNDLYGNRAYLVHTLPVTTNQKLISKMLTAFFFMFLTGVVWVVAILILMPEDVVDIPFILQSIPTVSAQFRAMTNMNFTVFVILMLLTTLVTGAAAMMGYYAAISLGQIFKKHKILGAILFYIVIYTVNQLISFFQLFFLSFTDIFYSSETPDISVILAFFGLGISIGLIRIGVLYLICYLFMEKHLNLN